MVSLAFFFIQRQLHQHAANQHSAWKMRKQSEKNIHLENNAMQRSFSFTTVALMIAICINLATAAAIYAGPVNFVELVKQTSKSVILILAHDETGAMVSQGSGFVISEDGFAVTNVHVLEKASSAVAKFSDGAYYEILGVTAIDCNADLAVIKLKSANKKFSYLTLADPESVKIGDSVFSIGNPLTSSIDAVTTEGTVSKGIVSGMRSWGEQAVNVLQTTAPISSGSSGGPLLNEKGEVIGVVTFEISMGQNLNFAVALNHLAPLLHGDQPKSIKEMMQICNDAEENPPQPDNTDPTSIAGTYSGIWKSDLSAASGAAIVKVRVENGKIYAKAILTGSPSGFRDDDLSAELEKFSEGVWVVDFKANHFPLEIRGIFKDDSFFGDYQFQLEQTVDRGQWKLAK